MYEIQEVFVNSNSICSRMMVIRAQCFVQIPVCRRNKKWTIRPTPRSYSAPTVVSSCAVEKV